MPIASVQPDTNAVLAALPPEEWRRLSPYVEPAVFEKGQVLYDCGDIPRYAYFPASGMFSVLATSEAGMVAQVGSISSREFATVSVLWRLPATSEVVVTIRGAGYRVRGEPLRQTFQRCGEFQAEVFRLVERLLTEAARAVVCHRYHTVRERLARWLLDADDCVGGAVLQLTQEGIAELLAMPRSAVSAAASSLHDHGIIHQRHGRVRVLRRQRLEALACECYRALQRPGPRPPLSNGPGAPRPRARSEAPSRGEFGV